MESLMNFSIERKGGWGNKYLILTCKQCGLEIDHVYLDWSKWKDTNNVRIAGILSEIEYEWETHLAQNHECETKSWTKKRKAIPEYVEWLKTKNETLWRARWRYYN